MSHAIMKAKKSPDLLSASWRSQKSSWCNSVCIQRPKNQRTTGVKSQSESEGPKTKSIDVQRQEKVDVPDQAKSKFALPPPFCPVEALKRLDVAHLHW